MTGAGAGGAVLSAATMFLLNWLLHTPIGCRGHAAAPLATGPSPQPPQRLLTLVPVSYEALMGTEAVTEMGWVRLFLRGRWAEG